jgi:hypothetical protein
MWDCNTLKNRGLFYFGTTFRRPQCFHAATNATRFSGEAQRKRQNEEKEI